MHFDDRLETVLRHRSGGTALARIQYRQLLDLLGTLPIEAKGPQIDAACDRLVELGRSIGAGERAAMLRDRGLRLRNPRLISLLATDVPVVALAAIEAAQLDEEEWIDLAPALPLSARGLLRNRRDLGPSAMAMLNRLGVMAPGLPSAEMEPQADVIPLMPKSIAAAEPRPAAEGIGAIVKRIEDFRKSRQPPVDQGTTDSPRLPLGEIAAEPPRPPVQAFDFATNVDGQVTWADPGMAPLAIGVRLPSLDVHAGLDSPSALIARFRARQPIDRLVVELSGAPAIAGRWQVDATPNFDPQSGRFTGYAGRMRRIVPDAANGAIEERDSEADRMRQVLHELRTPVNAIQGFAEVIQQQLFGPTPHEYRALAAAIAADAARMLAGFEELDRLARLESGTMQVTPGSCDFRETLAATIEQLRPFTESRNSGFRLDGSSGAKTLAMDRLEADRLAWRLLATLAGAANPGEVLPLQIRADGPMIESRVQLPASLASQDDEALLNALTGHVPKALSAGMFGAGFSLRLATAEAQAAGGSLKRRETALCLRLPALAASQPVASQVDDPGALPG